MLKHIYKRKYFRVKPFNSLKCEMTIKSFMSRSVKLGTAAVKVINISPGGMMFSSSLSFPVTSGLVLRFEIDYPGLMAYPEGYIIHKNSKAEGKYEYGVIFINEDESMRRLLARLFSGLMLKADSFIMIKRPNQR